MRSSGPVARPLSSFGAPRPVASYVASPESTPPPTQQTVYVAPVSRAPFYNVPEVVYVAPVIRPFMSLPAFRPAPTFSKQQEDDTIMPSKLERHIDHGCLLTLIGTFLLLMAVLTPVWDAYRLLGSSTVVYFMGRTQCFWIIVFCCAVVLFFFILMGCTERYGRRDMNSVMESFLGLFMTSFTVLGLGLLLMSVGLRSSAERAYTDLMLSANSSTPDPANSFARPLSEYYHVLLNIRMQPDCLDLPSVEDCDGFEERYPYTGYLKHMENEYSCSGFCYDNSFKNLSKIPALTVLMQHHASASDEVTSDFVGLLQSTQFAILPPVSPMRLLPEELPPAPPVQKADVLQAARSSPFQSTSKKTRISIAYNRTQTNIQGLFLLAANRSMAKSLTGIDPSMRTMSANAQKLISQSADPEKFGDTVHNMAETGWMQQYPPTLFSSANYKTSCDGEAGREIHFSAEEVAYVLYIQSSIMLLISIVLGFVKMCTMSRSDDLQEAEIVTDDCNPESDKPYFKKVVL